MMKFIYTCAVRPDIQFEFQVKVKSNNLKQCFVENATWMAELSESSVDGLSIPFQMIEIQPNQFIKIRRFNPGHQSHKIAFIPIVKANKQSTKHWNANAVFIALNNVIRDFLFLFFVGNEKINESLKCEAKCWKKFSFRTNYAVYDRFIWFLLKYSTTHCKLRKCFCQFCNEAKENSEFKTVSFLRITF